MADHSYIIPGDFCVFMGRVFGEKGAAWAAGLPDLLARLERRWQVRIEAPFALSFNYVAPVTRADGTQAVLKVGVPHNELFSEIAALRHFNGRGIARLLEADPDLGAMLLERIAPGTTLAEAADQPGSLLTDDQATRTAALVMRELWAPAPENDGGVLLTAERWALHGMAELRETFGGGTGPYPARLVEGAERLFAELLGSAPERVLLHGDLHHWNILDAGPRGWLALDPKGVIGEPAYEIGALIRNRWLEGQGTAAVRARAERRLAILSETLGLDRQRVTGYAAAQAVLSAWWSYADDREGCGRLFPLAEVLFDLAKQPR